jgi:hypothetical protein
MLMARNSSSSAAPYQADAVQSATDLGRESSFQGDGAGRLARSRASDASEDLTVIFSLDVRRARKGIACWFTAGPRRSLASC